MGILEKMVSSGEYILGTIKLTIEYDIPIVSNINLRVRTEMTTEEPDNNFIIILEDRILSSELSYVSEDFKSMTVNNNNNIKEPQLKKRKRNKYYYMKNITHGFQFNIASNKKMDIIKYI